MKRIFIVDEVENYLFNKYLSMYYISAVLSTNKWWIKRVFFPHDLIKDMKTNINMLYDQYYNKGIG